MQQLIADEGLYRELYDRYGDYFTGAMRRRGDPDPAAELRHPGRGRLAAGDHPQRQGPKKQLRALKRLKVVAAFQTTGNSPMGMVLDRVLVIPPDLRLMAQLDGGRFATRT